MKEVVWILHCSHDDVRADVTADYERRKEQSEEALRKAGQASHAALLALEKHQDHNKVLTDRASELEAELKTVRVP